MFCSDRSQYAAQSNGICAVTTYGAALDISLSTLPPGPYLGFPNSEELLSEPSETREDDEEPNPELPCGCLDVDVEGDEGTAETDPEAVFLLDPCPLLLWLRFPRRIASRKFMA